MAIAGTTEQAFESAEAQAKALAAAVADKIRAGVAERGEASLVVTGGSTPGPLYDVLCKAELPWDRVRLTLSDERWVAPDDPESNERLVRTRLLQGPAAAARLVGLKTPDASPQAALAAVAAAVAALPRPFAAVVLGMGEDGHVASLFPGDAAPEALDASGASLVAAARSPTGVPRLSLTMTALTDAEAVYLLVRGEAKRALLKDVAAGLRPHLPVSALLRQARSPVATYWAP